MKAKKFPAWDKRIGEFAKKIGKKPEEITEVLVTLVGEPSKESLDILADEKAVPINDLKEAMKGLKIPSGVFNTHIAILRGPKPEVKVEKEKNIITANPFSILPVLPDDDSFLKSLATGGQLKVDSTAVLSAIKAGLGKKVGLFDLPKLLIEKMEAYADSQDEPVGEDYYKLQKMLTTAKYGDVLKAAGVSGNFVSEAKKKKFFLRLENNLWSAVSDFHKQLRAWNEAWVQQGMNPNAIAMMFAAGSSGTQMPAGLMAAPDTSVLYSASESFADTVNKVFSGVGIPVAKALAYDATRIMGILENKDLPVQLGTSTKEQMLKELGVNVGSDMARVETSLTRYVLAVMSVDKVTKESELAYFSALFQLGNSIPWEKVGVNIQRSGLGVSGTDHL